MKEPIFILWARSFWLGILPTLLIVLDVVTNLLADPVQGPPIAGVLSAVFSSVLGVFGFTSHVDPVVVESTMLKLSPLFALVIAHQRSGAARPYSLNPRDST